MLRSPEVAASLPGCPRRDAVLQFRGLAEARCATLPEEIKLNEVKNGEGFAVGRMQSKCDVVVDSAFLPKFISGKHAEFEFDVQNNAWVVRDNKSTTKLYLNSKEVSEAVLKHGDKISFGWPGVPGAPIGAGAENKNTEHRPLRPNPYLYEFIIAPARSVSGTDGAGGINLAEDTVPVLTQRAIHRFADESCACEQPCIVQVSNLQWMEKISRWSMYLSDGVFKLRVLAVAELNDKFKNSQVVDTSIIRVTTTDRIVKDRKMIRDFEVVRGPCAVIGEPVTLKVGRKGEKEGGSETKEGAQGPVSGQAEGVENTAPNTRVVVEEAAKASACVANTSAKQGCMLESDPARGQSGERKLGDLAPSESDVCLWFEEMLDSGTLGNVPSEDKAVFLQRVQREGVDAEVALTLTDADLEDYGLTRQGDRRKTLVRIQERFAGATAAAVTPVQSRVTVPFQVAGTGGLPSSQRGEEGEQRPEGLGDTGADTAVRVAPARNPHLDRSVSEFARMGSGEDGEDSESEDEDEDGDQPLVSRAEFPSLGISGAERARLQSASESQQSTGSGHRGACPPVGAQSAEQSPAGAEAGPAKGRGGEEQREPDGKGGLETAGGGKGEERPWLAVGSSVEVLSEGEWWEAEVRETKKEAGGGASVLVFYVGGTEEESEWLGVGDGRVRPPVGDTEEKRAGGAEERRVGRKESGGGAAAPSTACPKKFKVGDPVRAQYRANGSWYGALIVGRKGEKFELKWEDGDGEDRLKTHEELRCVNPDAAYQIGDDVEGKRSTGRWYAAEVVEWSGQEYTLRWKDGSPAETCKPAQDLRQKKKRGRAGRRGGGKARGMGGGGAGKPAQTADQGGERGEDVRTKRRKL